MTVLSIFPPLVMAENVEKDAYFETTYESNSEDRTEFNSKASAHMKDSPKKSLWLGSLSLLVSLSLLIPRPVFL